jgi:hypothetical protein
MRVWAQSLTGRKVSEAQFAPFLKQAWQKSSTQSNAHSEFEACGTQVYPYAYVYPYVICKVNYYGKNGPQVDWIQCITCKKWLHESCTNATDMCDNCIV